MRISLSSQQNNPEYILEIKNVVSNSTYIFTRTYLSRERKTIQFTKTPRQQLDPKKSIQHNFLLYGFSYILYHRGICQITISRARDRTGYKLPKPTTIVERYFMTAKLNHSIMRQETKTGRPSWEVQGQRSEKGYSGVASSGFS